MLKQGVDKLDPDARRKALEELREYEGALRAAARAFDSGNLDQAQRISDGLAQRGLAISKERQRYDLLRQSKASAPVEPSGGPALVAQQKDAEARCAGMAADECGRSCQESKDPAICLAMAGRYFDGNGVKADPEKAIRLMREQCDAKYAVACMTVKRFMELGAECTTEANCSEGCNKALGSACLKLGSMFLEGNGAAKDPIAALQKFKRGCELGWGEACRAAGFVYGKGVGVPKSMASASEWMKKGCDLGDDSSCSQANNTACIADAVNAKQRRPKEDAKCKRVRDSGKNLHADPRKNYSAYEAPDESKLDLCYEAVMSEGCFQINVNKEPFYALYCCPR